MNFTPFGSLTLSVCLAITPVASFGAGRTASSTESETATQSDEKAGAGEFVAEDQTPSGKFLTATEIKPILGATQSSWVALREWDGQDLLYFTHLEAWRCGLHAVYYTMNDGDEQRWEMEPCYLNTAQPNAIKAEGRFPYTNFALGSAQKVRIRVLYDDNSEATAEFERASILMN
ncbi:MAG: hypothetical protein P8Q99_01050 [Paracoccaceae bacterium]|nr:hypothetical protein [Paracoccaceae bacterium]